MWLHDSERFYPIIMKLHLTWWKWCSVMCLSKDDGFTLLMLLSSGWLFGSLSASAPSSHGNKSFHCFSLKRLSIGTTWPSVVKMYLLSDLWSGLSSSNSCNAREIFLFVQQHAESSAKREPDFYSDNIKIIICCSSLLTNRISLGLQLLVQTKQAIHIFLLELLEWSAWVV